MRISNWLLTAAFITASTAAVADPFPRGDFRRPPVELRRDDRREELTGRVIQLTRDVGFLVESHAGGMDRDELYDVEQLLEQVHSRIAESIRRGGGNRPEPRPPGGPGIPGGPVSPLPPAPPFVFRRCVDAPIFEMGAAFNAIKNFAYSGSGLDLMSNDATGYAQRWVEQHGCQEAESWAREGYNIRAFAYAGNGLNLSSREASGYTQSALERRCYDHVDYVTEGARIYEFAYSGTGLNLMSRQASEYTRQKMEERFFSCGGRRF